MNAQRRWRASATMVLIAATAVLCGPLGAAEKAKSAWKIKADKKASLVTGSKNVHLTAQAVKGKTFILIGCQDAKQILRIAENFKLENGLNDALMKSDLQRSMQSGPQYERHGFEFSLDGNNFQTSVKLRFEGDDQFFESKVPMGYNDGTYFMILDEFIPQFITRMKNDVLLYVDVPYKDKHRDVTFSFVGFESVLKQAAEIGCELK